MGTQAKSKTYSTDLKESLRKLHEVKFIHRDIKLDNIVFSQMLNKYVLIDFGLTHPVSENVWEKTETKFQGTFDDSSF